MFSRLKTKMLKIFLCLDKSEMTDLQMKKAIVILLWIFCLAFLSISICSCINRERYPLEKDEADQILSYLSENHCLEELSWCDTIAVEGKIELSYWGDCDLEDAFDVSEVINNYLDSHPDSVVHKKQMELIVKMYSFEPDKLDYERQDYYASVSKAPKEQHINFLSIHTSETMKMSEFNQCQVSYKQIESTFNVDFDDYEAILSMDGLEEFCFSDLHIRSSKDNFIRVLDSLCYYEDSDIQIPFEFSFLYDHDLETTYDEFISTHKRYRIFPS